MSERLRVGVLGPLLLRRGETVVSAGPPQRRALLSALVLRRGTPASVRELADELWGEEAPPSAVAVIRSYVHQLRRTLGSDPAAGVAIQSSSGGYFAEIAAGVLDLQVFERLVADADRARTAGDRVAAADRLREALGLWRGPALADVAGPGADRHRRALAQRQLSALTTRLALDLELDRHHAVVPELHSLVLAHPLNEHLRQLVMTALYRCGRQADAIATYQQCRRLLADELGVDPGPELQQCYLRVVRGDPDLVGAASSPVGRPAHLPASPAVFVGREEALRRADVLLAAGGPGPVITVISGMGGVGKTTLALRWAHRVAPDYADGQLYADLRGYGPGRDPAAPAEILGGFLQALGVAASDVPDHPEVRAGLFRSLVADRRMIILLDNAATTDQVRELLPGTGHCLVIVTSRGTLSGLLVRDGARLLTLLPPGHDEAAALFAARVGPDRVRAEPRATRDIVERSGRLPLALAVVAARAVVAEHIPLGVMADELNTAHGTLAAFRTPDASVDVSVVLSWSYRALGARPAEAFRRLCLHPGPHLSVDAAASMLALTRTETRILLDELAAAALLLEELPGRYAMHDLVRAFGQDRSRDQDDEQERRAVVHRLLDHYVHTTRLAAHQLFAIRHQILPERPVDGVICEAPEPADWYQSEYTALLAALDLADRERFDRHAWQLAALLRDHLNRQGMWHHLQVSQQTGVAAAVRSGDPAAEGRALWGLALADANMGRHQEACGHLHRALAIFTETGAREDAAATRSRIGYLLTEQGDHVAALEHAHETLALYPPGTDPARRAGALNSVSWLYAQLGQLEEAADHVRQALALDVHLSPYALADTWDTLGFIQARQERIDDAADSYRRAAAIYRRHGAHFREAGTLRALGDAYQRAGRARQAQDVYRQALERVSTTDDPGASRLGAELARLLARQ
ncbi:DNA-binding SARP family transcriptional activator/Flp pilus assembly protein TadD [Streptomyces sp. SAI-135]|nr:MULTISPECIES: BTAD domain-containing putative transcriptional regulator [unclassified Streptomyces]MDH6523032.1 DNA-binding SARP family transcriptional activator/tetratricopeptide (TPR) repeat protein [Streptomyces sp. SAI-090]MDH6573915.1 DNA-binding SARP family transcriptional activator/tetratricopeptide (TPR) repeat protein [Streptomyces sp. SAI-117]MDH6581349.1 DNA-binding SARP family transcriptional activator/tetratricopeptide (TPR) repeat protein [Streptomyces sp. SAI-133]MDH6613355.1 